MSRADTLFFELFEPLPRQGPGNLECLQRALALCGELPPAPRIVDLGCGSGMQTVDVARATGGTVLAVDTHAPNVERVRTRAAEAGLVERIEARVADMAALQPDEPFDLVWSEGALYNLGLAKALPLCARLLRPGGVVAFTDAVWLRDDPPEDVRALFADYPTMGSVDDVLKRLRSGGWTILGHFVLPDAAWWDDFYTPMEQRLEALRRRYEGNVEALAILEQLAEEPRMHRRSAAFYGYAFFVARRPID
jgi:SAM-dependent methyltransferase